MLRDGSPIGAINVARAQVGSFSENHIALLKTFADQAVIAIENVRLFTELEARNRDLTATSEILRVISSSPTDLQPVFDTIVRSVVRLCNAFFSTVFLYDGHVISLAAIHNAPAEGVEALRRIFPGPPIPDLVASRAVLSRTTVHVHDALADTESPRMAAVARAIGNRTIIAVPMLRDGQSIGALGVSRREVQPFSETEIALLQTFADQAVIAIENVRLFKELEARNRDLTEALEQQTATAEILRVISSSPTDVQPVFDTIAVNAARLCNSLDAVILRVDGAVLRRVASYGLIETLPLGETLPVDRGFVVGRAVRDVQTIHVPDLFAVEAEFPDGAALARRHGYRTLLTAPLVRDGVALGAIVIRRAEMRPFTPAQVKLLQTFADQAAIAIENVRLFKELEARNRDLTEALEQQTATAEILRVISSSPTDVQPVFETIVRNAVSLCGGLFSNVFRFDGELLHFAASNLGPDYVELLQAKYPIRPTVAQVSGRVPLTKSIVRLQDALDDREYDQEFARVGGWRRMLGVPMLREGNPLGAIVVGWAEPGPVPTAQVELLKTFADQAV